MATTPFADALFPEVCGRVAFRLVELAYRHRDANGPVSGPATVSRVIADLPRPRPEMLYAALLGLNHALVLHHCSAVQWRDRCTLHSRAGCDFRRCYHDEYKANRRKPSHRRSR